MPSKKVFRESGRHVRLMILFLFTTTISLAILNCISDDIGLYLGAYLAAISFFGYLVKLTLSFLFPVIVLDKTGIKFLNSNPIKWTEIRSIKVKINSNSEQVVYVNSSIQKSLKRIWKKTSFQV